MKVIREIFVSLYIGSLTRPERFNICLKKYIAFGMSYEQATKTVQKASDLMKDETLYWTTLFALRDLAKDN